MQTYATPSKEEERISRIVDSVLTKVFGKEATCLIYQHLEHKYAVKRNEVAERIDLFAKGLEEFLSSGAYVVERKILEDISSNYGSVRKLQLETIGTDADFADQVRSIMRKA